MNKQYEQFLANQTHVGPRTKELMEVMFRSFPVNPGDLNGDYFRERMKHVAPSTLRTEVSLAKRFLEFASMDASSLDKKHLKLPKVEASVTVEDLYTSDELRRILEQLSTTRDRAMIEVLYESAARATELLSMTVENIRFHPSNDTASVIVKGKTGTREIPIYSSVPALKAYLNVHPTKKGALWVTMRGKQQVLDYDTLYKIVKVAIRKADIGRKVKRHLHMFRHTRATELVRRGVRGQSLNKVMGWTPRSNMESVYVHLSTADVNNEMFSKVFGLEEAQEKPHHLIEADVCLSCGAKNPQGAYVCTKCNAPLTEDKIREALQQSQDSQDTTKRLEYLEDKLERLARFQDSIGEKMLVNVGTKKEPRYIEVYAVEKKED